MRWLSTSLPPPDGSPRARELGRRLKATIESFRRENPKLSKAEVEQATRIASPELGRFVPLWVVEIIVAILLCSFAFLYLL
ncbi:MAG: hypothetical protein AAF657_15640 [Acidobacteriota bacterium]